MKIDNNTIIVLCGTTIALAMIIAIISGLLPEQVMLILAGGAVTLGGTIIGNLQRKPSNEESTESDTNEPQENQ